MYIFTLFKSFAQHILAIFTLIGIFLLGQKLTIFIALPAALLGLLVLLILLLLLGRVPDFLAQTTPLYLRFMSVFFIPAIVGGWLFKDIVVANFWPIFIAILGTTALSLLLTLGLAKALLPKTDHDAKNSERC
ncbi:CidA/LrgA family protein [Opacimonas viscosa]|uniref:CidA/LrgA family protein n=1 Tax=Opacimonas viscosa TaxID=2961944 RepID=A0AA41WWL6_9ALTE|nr:CidA/LrgA family protein [Opacimonas viscosa]MCP3427715.1 CidA/LrgA family protein [Opacimonas viscosa]